MVLSEFASISEYPSIESKGYRMHLWAPEVAFLTYVSAHRDAAGGLSHHTLRSSLWVQVAWGWQLAFHQGDSDHGPGVACNLTSAST